MRKKDKEPRYLKGFATAEQRSPSNSRKILAVVLFVGISLLIILAISIKPTNLSSKEIATSNISTSPVKASLEHEYTFFRSGELEIEERVTVNNSNNRLQHGIRKRLPIRTSYSPPGKEDQIVHDLDIEILKRSILQEGTEIAGLEHKEATLWENEYFEHYIGGKNLKLDALTYSFVLRYRIKNLGEIFHSGADFNWRVIAPAGLKVNSYRAKFVFPPYVEANNIKLNAKLITTKFLPNGRIKVENSPDLIVSKIFPANNQEAAYRNKEIVIGTIELKRPLEPYEFALASVNIPSAYIDP